jgi:hypothetical protein
MILEIIYMEATVGVAAIIGGSAALISGAISFASNKKKEKRSSSRISQKRS